MKNNPTIFEEDPLNFQLPEKHKKARIFFKEKKIRKETHFQDEKDEMKEMWRVPINFQILLFSFSPTNQTLQSPTVFKNRNFFFFFGITQALSTIYETQIPNPLIRVK